MQTNNQKKLKNKIFIIWGLFITGVILVFLIILLLAMNKPQPQTEKQEQEQEQYQFDWNSNYDNDDNKLVKDIAVVTLATGAAVISCVVLAPIFASVGPIAAPLALLA
uniref:hypothetical protein n=1 Tax=Onion yellows phytoplasma TaxID=100379 RepID=UPI00159EE44A|nr:hypothetical protein [Onion yellows phytoplasma]